MKHLILGITIVVMMTASSQEKWNKIEHSGFAQGTSYNINYYADHAIVSQFQIDSIFLQIDSSLSIYKSYSLITQFNQNGIVKPDIHFLNVMNKSIKTYEETHGAFDITVYPLVEEWGFGLSAQKKTPDSLMVNTIKKCVGSKMLILNENKIKKLNPCTKIDVNGIAQGYTVDVIANFLEKKGIAHFIIELGGEVRVKGRKQPGNEKMKIGIETPTYDPFEKRVLQKIISFEQGAVTTSGSYRKYRENNGKKISHIIDPRSGYPVENELISVTVFAEDAITADAFDNAFMVMGLKKSLLFLEEKSNMAAYFIYSKPDGTVTDTLSKNFNQLLTQ